MGLGGYGIRRITYQYAYSALTDMGRGGCKWIYYLCGFKTPTQSFGVSIRAVTDGARSCEWVIFVTRDSTFLIRETEKSLLNTLNCLDKGMDKYIFWNGTPVLVLDRTDGSYQYITSKQGTEIQQMCFHTQ
jgi:hypothetical protein